YRLFWHHNPAGGQLIPKAYHDLFRYPAPDVSDMAMTEFHEMPRHLTRSSIQSGQHRFRAGESGHCLVTNHHDRYCSGDRREQRMVAGRPIEKNAIHGARADPAAELSVLLVRLLRQVEQQPITFLMKRMFDLARQR